MMLRKKKKKEDKPLLTFTKLKLLHSKSTYFYKQWLDSLDKACHDIFANRFWVRLFSLRENAQFPEERGANRTRRSPSNTNPYGKNAHGRLGFHKPYLLPVVCSIVLLLVLGICINPVLPGGGGERAYAAITEDLGDGASISLSISNDGVEVVDDSTVSTGVKPGEIAYISNDITISTTKIKRYYVGVQSVEASSSLVGTNTNATIDGVGDSIVPANFGDNTWGYALTDNTNAANSTLAYSTLPAYTENATVQYQSKDNPTNGTYKMKLVFAANIRADRPADHYRNTAIVSVAAEARDMLWADYGLTTMQGMTSSICSSAEEGTTGQLRDTRDSKTYWVTKLKDGNCWMTQNLDLDIPAEGLKAADTDIAVDWNSSSAVKPVATEVTTTGGFGTTVASYDPGRLYCNNTVNSRVVACNATTSVSDGHDSVGNYYNWVAAIAGEYGPEKPPADDYDITTEQSICPKGWGLPTQGIGNNLFSIYEISDSLSSSDMPGYNNTSILLESPFYFLDSTHSYSAGGKFDTSSLGGFWLSDGGSFDFDAFSVYFMSFSVRWNYASAYFTTLGDVLFSVRCVAR